MNRLIYKHQATITYKARVLNKVKTNYLVIKFTW